MASVAGGTVVDFQTMKQTVSLKIFIYFIVFLVDWIADNNSIFLSCRLGCTRLQLGIQHVDDEILKLNNRGHGVDKSISAIAYARDAGFKVDGHLMPDLPGAICYLLF